MSELFGRAVARISSVTLKDSYSPKLKSESASVCGVYVCVVGGVPLTSASKGQVRPSLLRSRWWAPRTCTCDHRKTCYIEVDWWSFYGGFPIVSCN